jgi:hypothetical protein
MRTEETESCCGSELHFSFAPQCSWSLRHARRAFRTEKIEPPQMRRQNGPKSHPTHKPNSAGDSSGIEDVPQSDFCEGRADIRPPSPPEIGSGFIRSGLASATIQPGFGD